MLVIFHQISIADNCLDPLSKRKGCQTWLFIFILLLMILKMPYGYLIILNFTGFFCISNTPTFLCTQFLFFFINITSNPVKFALLLESTCNLIAVALLDCSSISTIAELYKRTILKHHIELPRVLLKSTFIIPCVLMHQMDSIPGLIDNYHWDEPNHLDIFQMPSSLLSYFH